jgi:shikimate dehydrogenase
MPTWREIAPNADAGVRLGLVGDPISDSLYPAMVAHALAGMGIHGEYVPFLVSSAEFDQCIFHLQSCGFMGVNVSLPHKAKAARVAERFFEVKHSVGVANALSFRDGIFGQNTEVPAFLKPIGESKPGVALVLGAGPASRTAITGLLLQGWRVKVWNKNAMRSRLIASVLKRMGDIELVPYANPAGCDLVVNATRIGVKPGEQPPVEWKNVKIGAIAYDFVFRKNATDFLRSASVRGVRTIDGREMLVEKAGLAMEWWLDRSVPREPMRRAVGLPPKTR